MNRFALVILALIAFAPSNADANSEADKNQICLNLDRQLTSGTTRAKEIVLFTSAFFENRSNATTMIQSWYGQTLTDPINAGGQVCIDYLVDRINTGNRVVGKLIRLVIETGYDRKIGKVEMARVLEMR